MTWYLVLFVVVIVGTVIAAQREPKEHPPYSRPRHRRSKRPLPFIIHYRGRPFKPTTTVHLPISKN